MSPSAIVRGLLLVLLCVAGQAAAQGYTQGGISGAYFANGTLSGTPSFTRQDVRIRFAWNGAAPGGSSSPGFAAVPATGFSVRWTGSLVAPASGVFAFTATTSGPARLWLSPVGGTPVEVIAYAGSSTATNTGRYRLTAGARYAVTFEFQDEASPAVAELDWAGPGIGAARAIEPAVPLGVNLTSNADWDGTRLFADAMKQSRGWASPTDFSTPVPSDGAGWPIEDFLVIPVAGPPELNGTYAMSFHGLAQVQIDFGYGSFVVGGTNYGGTLPSGVGYDAKTNTTSAQLIITPTTGINVFMVFTNTQRNAGGPTNAGLTDLKLMRPTAPGATQSYAPLQLFNGALEAALAPFTTIRAMTYLDTNGTTIAHWSERVRPTQPIQAQFNGGALEYAVMLANETGKDLWVNVPVSADPDYVTKLAQLLRYGSDGNRPYTAPQAKPRFPPLQPNLAAYVEYSNEVWNGEFAQFGTNLAAAEAEVAAGHSPLDYDGETNVYYWAWRRVALRIAQISQQFREIWGDAAMGSTIRPVLEWQTGDGQATGDQQLDFLADWFDNADGLPHVATPHPPSYYLWGAGGGWYHSVNDPDASSIAAIYASGLASPVTVPVDAAWAHSFGLVETGYEGGFEIGDDSPTALQLAADLAPQAQGFEGSGLDYFFAQGGGLGMIFDVAGASAYGLADPTIYDAGTPKFAAVTALVGGAPPIVSYGNPVAGATSLSTTLADVAHNIWGSFGSTVYVGQGCWLNWTVNVSVPGRYTIATNLGALAGQAISVDGRVIGNSGTSVSLGTGLHGIHVRNLGTGSLALITLTLTP
jgi:hypothetical protein